MLQDRTLRWRPLGSSGLEHLRVVERDGAIVLRGVVIADRDDADCAVSYAITLDADWGFRAVTLESDSGLTVALTRDGAGRWADGDGPREDLAGCIDIDISGSPTTNTLPIRRIRDWVVGEPRRFAMAYIALPGLMVSRHEQIYTKLGADRFRYQNADGSFEAQLSVDEDGFVIDYPTLFARV
ncbi:putative glycolipid-binding domain-containing protein [Pelagibacterium luteolum]|uniref:Uncharacterized protein n=1 Tax=Pelagibacterium luteolum TaxID=440168 RepID=A0A1G7ZC19_9HYPH|nr:putative glycolipid-binding domain-containing protein [Pelagibacterium luteolum]SDH06179.1 hypothetical protein SAMN04487974_11911 [Pelagibacterium luteolum]